MTALYLFIAAYLPGALIYRIPDRTRGRRAALAADERAFWAVLISAAWSSLVVIGLAACGAYTFPRLLTVNLAVSALVLLAFRQRLSFARTAPRPGWRAVYPIVLLAIGAWLYFPTAEYIVGGRDPGVYINEGIQIAQRGRLVVLDPVVSSLPAASRDLFFPSHKVPEYYGVRFMGFFVVEPSSGAVVGQFPQLYPAWVAVGYGVYGLTGALYALGGWALVGLVAVYMLGARLIGPTAAFAAAALLSISLVQVWFARYPNSEMMAQALFFGGLLAYTRAHVDGDRFFAPVAGAILGLTLFLRFDAIVMLAGVFIAAVAMLFDGKRPRAAFVLTFTIVVACAGWYLTTVMAQYMVRPIGFVRNLRPGHIALLTMGMGALAALAAASRSARMTRTLRAWVPVAVSAVTILGAAYAWFLRPSIAGGGLAIHDAMALRTFALYLPTAAIAAAIIGHSLLTRGDFWRDPPFIVAFTVCAFFVFYKMQIWPEHFWLARRYLPIVFPGSLLLIAAIVTIQLRSRPRLFGLLRAAIPAVFMIVLAWILVRTMLPIRRHIEYEGLIPRVEALAQQFGDTDLVVVESRDAGGDVHVFGTPLAYIYARNVLVLNSASPDKALFRDFLTWARSHYREVYFLGGGGTDVLSRTIGVAPLASERFQVPEYDRRQDAYPQRVTFKEFEYGVYRFVVPAPAAPWFALDIGTMDDLHVVRFNAKERSQTGTTFRWTRARSYVSIPGMRATDRLAMLWMSAGPRPAAAGPARVRVLLNDRAIGAVDVAAPFAPYSFSIPVDIASAAAAADQPARLTIESAAWNPLRATGAADDRELGVMVDRVEVR